MLHQFHRIAATAAAVEAHEDVMKTSYKCPTHYSSHVKSIRTMRNKRRKFYELNHEKK